MNFFNIGKTDALTSNFFVPPPGDNPTDHTSPLKNSIGQINDAHRLNQVKIIDSKAHTKLDCIKDYLTDTCDAIINLQAFGDVVVEVLPRMIFNDFSNKGQFITLRIFREDTQENDCESLDHLRVGNSFYGIKLCTLDEVLTTPVSSWYLAPRYSDNLSDNTKKKFTLISSSAQETETSRLTLEQIIEKAFKDNRAYLIDLTFTGLHEQRTKPLLKKERYYYLLNSWNTHHHIDEIKSFAIELCQTADQFSMPNSVLSAICQASLDIILSTDENHGQNAKHTLELLQQVGASFLKNEILTQFNSIGIGIINSLKKMISEDELLESQRNVLPKTYLQTTLQLLVHAQDLLPEHISLKILEHPRIPDKNQYILQYKECGSHIPVFQFSQLDLPKEDDNTSLSMCPSRPLSASLLGEKNYETIIDLIENTHSFITQSNHLNSGLKGLIQLSDSTHKQYKEINDFIKQENSTAYFPCLEQLSSFRLHIQSLLKT